MAKPKREDKSVRVLQKEKLKQELQIREFPWTERQKEFIQLAQRKDINIVFVKGPAGSAKTSLSVFSALKALNEKKIGEIIYVRSIVESADHSLGFLKGSEEEKLSPYLQPLKDKLQEYLTKPQTDGLVAGGHIRGIPVGFLRGLSFNGAYIVADEMQNCGLKELLTIATRIGQHSKLFLLGDTRQADIKHSGFAAAYDAFDNPEALEHGIACFSFGLSDIMRSDVVKYIIEKFDSIKLT